MSAHRFIKTNTKHDQLRIWEQYPMSQQDQYEFNFIVSLHVSIKNIDNYWNKCIIYQQQKNQVELGKYCWKNW